MLKHNRFSQHPNKLKTVKKLLALTLSSVLVSLPSTAVEVNENGDYVWSFLSGQPWPNGYNRNTGKPNNLVWARNEYSDEFFERINNALPERQLNEAFLAGDEGNTITLSEEAEVFITFIHEGAGYRNSFGFFTFDAENPPQTQEDTNVTIVFPNLSYPHMTNGHRLSIGTFPAGTSIGFFIAANGYWWYSGVKDFAVPYYFSLNSLNNEPTEALKQHTVMLYDEEVSEVIIGFEDLPRSWGDNDFNDAIFSVKSTPSTAISNENLTTMPDVNDSDADGLSDELDEFPDDYRRAYSSYYPNASDWVTLAFEDNWPSVGDYDLNDLVIRERLQTIYNADGGISGFKLTGFIDARGASKRNGFGLRILDSTPDLIAEMSITIDGVNYEKTVEAFQSNAVVQMWRDTHVFTTTGGSGKCSHFNTVKTCPSFDPVPFELDVYFDGTRASLNHSDLDFFLFRTNKRHHEIHFAGYPPTDLFSPFLFGKGADNSDPNENRYFKSTDNLPWALKINSEWNYPREYIDVLWAYPQYEQWVESSGTEATNWYSDTSRLTHKFKQ